MNITKQIQVLIKKNEVTSAKRGRSVFYLSTYDDPALLNKDNYTLICRQYSPSSAKTLRREKMLMEHFNKFNNLKKESQILNIDYFAVELGCYASDLDAKDYQKVPLPELSEIDEESDSNSITFFNGTT